MDKAFKDAFFEGYVECALWSETDESDPSGGEPLDSNYGAEDIAPEAMAEMRKDCDDFCDENKDLLCESGLDPAQAGHDFMLTRNGHGAGFWDRGLGDVGDDLSDAARVYGTQGLYVGDDGKIYTHG